MAAPAGHIIAFGGGGFSMEAGNPLLDEYVLSVAGRERPRVCFLPSASGDADHYIVRFYRAFAGRCDSSHISLFRQEREAVRDWRRHLLEQDVIYVGGGSVISLLGVWRAHGLDSIVREAWAAGAVLCGVSAGSLCWFAEAVSEFHGEAVRVRGMGMLPWSNCVHYRPERGRDDPYRRFLREGMQPGFAAEDGTAVHFEGEALVGAVSSRPDAAAYRMRAVGGRVVRTALDIRYLGGQGTAIAAAPRTAGSAPPLPAPLSGVRRDRRLAAVASPATAAGAAAG
jgi:dipeptidase E